MTDTPTPAATTDAEVAYADLVNDKWEQAARRAFRHILKHHGIVDGVIEADLVASAKALAATPPSSAPALEGLREAAWLIEFPEAGDRYEHSKRVGPALPVEWLAGIPWGERWKSRTNDPNKAIRFVRKADAEAAMLIMQLAGTVAFASEHIWLASPNTETAGERE
jgi:hypothetical protein